MICKVLYTKEILLKKVIIGRICCSKQNFVPSAPHTKKNNTNKKYVQLLSFRSQLIFKSD